MHNDLTSDHDVDNDLTVVVNDASDHQSDTGILYLELRLNILFRNNREWLRFPSPIKSQLKRSLA